MPASSGSMHIIVRHSISTSQETERSSKWRALNEAVLIGRGGLLVIGVGMRWLGRPPTSR